MRRANIISQMWYYKKRYACIGALLCCLLWGSAFPCIKTGYRIFGIDAGDTASQILFAGCRFSMAGILVILFGSILSRRVLLPGKQAVPKVLILSLFQTILQYLFFYWGLAHASGVSSSIINGSGTFFAILFAALLFRKEALNMDKIFGMLLGFFGVILVSTAGNSTGIAFRWNGEGFILISSLCYAVSSVLIKIFGEKENPVILSGYQFFTGGVVMTVWGTLSGGRLSVGSVSGAVLLLYLAFLSAAAYTLWGILLKYHPVSGVAIWGFCTPVFGVLLSALFLNETENINLFCLLALVFVSAGIYLVNRSEG